MVLLLHTYVLSFACRWYVDDCQIKKPSYLNHLTRACKEFRLAFQPFLYKELVIVLRRDWWTVRFLEQLVHIGAEGLHSTRGITVSVKADEIGKETPWAHPDHDELYGVVYLNADVNDDGNFTRLGIHGRFQARVLNDIIRLIIKKALPQSLQHFWQVTRVGYSTI